MRAIPLSIYGTSCMQDVLFTLIRTALHQLDDQICQISMLFRNPLGIGDAMDENKSMSHMQFAERAAQL